MHKLVQLNHIGEMAYSNKKEYAWVVALAADCDAAFDAHGKANAKKCILARASVGDLRQALQDGDGVIRRKTLQLLSILEPREALEDVSGVLAKDPCPVVRHEAAFFLGALRIQEAVDPLCQAMLYDKEDLVRHEAAEALGDLGFKSALSALNKATKDASSVVRDTAQLAILQLEKSS